LTKALPFGQQEEQYLKRPEVKILIPDVLRLKLVDDWEAVTKSHQVCAIYVEASIQQQQSEPVP
jgi:mortality factor 4-like protein 1